jgi:cytidylate kinase
MGEKKIVITIDGWSSCGKSTLARQLADKLKYTYIDSGAMYRAITLYFLRNHVDWTRHEAVVKALGEITLRRQSLWMGGILERWCFPKLN